MITNMRSKLNTPFYYFGELNKNFKRKRMEESF